MIHIAIGTKAQLIKMSPLMRQLKEKKIAFNFINLGQHSLITKRLIKELRLDIPQQTIFSRKNVSTIIEGIVWAVNGLIKAINRYKLKKDIFKGQGGICLIHGDTASTIIALFLARRAKIKVAHIESGLRSYNYLEPFPEEIVRIVAMKYSDILFAPSQWAYNNLIKMDLGYKSNLICANTSLEALKYSLNNKIKLNTEFSEYVLFTVHRMENIFSKKKMQFIISVLLKIADKIPVLFIQHPPTMKQLAKFNLIPLISERKNIKLFSLLSHGQFVHILNNAQFVITDGGSIQEEAYYLNKPCLLLRNYTERKEGIGENVVLSKFSRELIDDFIEHYNTFFRETVLPECSPSEQIIKYIENFI